MSETTTTEYGDWQDGGNHALGQYWYRGTSHADDCNQYADECACDIQIQSVFEDMQDGPDNHQFYAWHGGPLDHDQPYNGMTGLYPSRDEAVAALESQSE